MEIQNKEMHRIDKIFMGLVKSSKSYSGGGGWVYRTYNERTYERRTAASLAGGRGGCERMYEYT